MTQYFISRHPTTIDWAKTQGIDANFLEHLDINEVNNGDVVIGTLPVSLAAEVCQKGARYIHIHLDIPYEKRGAELSLEDLNSFGIELIEYEVKRKQT